MLGSPVIDVAIGMTFIFLALSLVASAIQEILSSLVQSRPANLFNGIRSLFSGDLDLLEKLYLHGIIAGLYKDPPHDFGGKGKSLFPKIRNLLQPVLGIRLIGVENSKLGAIDPLLLPAYIPPRAFAVTIIDILNPDKTPAPNMMNGVVARLNDSIKACKDSDKDSRAHEALLSLALRAGDDVSKFQTSLEQWYSDAMDRVSGWYKKYTQNVLLVIGLVLAMIFNVDSIRVGTTLWTNRDARQALVTSATTFLQRNSGAGASASTKPPATAANPVNVLSTESSNIAAAKPTGAAASVAALSARVGAAPAAPADATRTVPIDTLAKHLSDTVQTFDGINRQMLLPLGWRHSFHDYVNAARANPFSIPRTLLGWIITAIALSLGAPFWFDTLNKFMVVRSTVKPQEKSQTDKTKDG
jgi:hypothetical protein